MVLLLLTLVCVQELHAVATKDIPFVEVVFAELLPTQPTPFVVAASIADRCEHERWV